MDKTDSSVGDGARDWAGRDRDRQDRDVEPPAEPVSAGCDDTDDDWVPI